MNKEEKSNSYKNIFNSIVKKVASNKSNVYNTKMKRIIPGNSSSISNSSNIKTNKFKIQNNTNKVFKNLKKEITIDSEKSENFWQDENENPTPANYQKYKPPLISIYSRSINDLINKENKNELIRKQNFENEVKECTFFPITNISINSIKLNKSFTNKSQFQNQKEVNKESEKVSNRQNDLKNINFIDEFSNQNIFSRNNTESNKKFSENKLNKINKISYNNIYYKTYSNNSKDFSGTNSKKKSIQSNFSFSIKKAKTGLNKESIQKNIEKVKEFANSKVYNTSRDFNSNFNSNIHSKSNYSLRKYKNSKDNRESYNLNSKYLIKSNVKTNTSKNQVKNSLNSKIPNSSHSNSNSNSYLNIKNSAFNNLDSSYIKNESLKEKERNSFTSKYLVDQRKKFLKESNTYHRFLKRQENWSIYVREKRENSIQQKIIEEKSIDYSFQPKISKLDYFYKGLNKMKNNPSSSTTTPLSLSYSISNKNEKSYTNRTQKTNYSYSKKYWVLKNDRENSSSNFYNRLMKGQLRNRSQNKY